MRFYLVLSSIVLLFISCSKSTLDRRMSEAEAFLGLGNYEKALEVYRDVASHCPSYKRCAEVLLRIGDIEANMMGNPDGALIIYDRMIKMYPLKEADVVAREKKASIYERRGDYLGAVGEYAKLLQYFPKRKKAFYYLLKLGESYLSMGNFNQARIELKGLVDSNGIDPEIRERAIFAFGESYFLQGRLGLAEKNYRKLVEEYPDSSLAYEAKMKIATCQEERGFLGDATKTLKSIREEYPNKAVIDDRLKAMRKRGKERPMKLVLEEQKELDKLVEEKEKAPDKGKEKDKKQDKAEEQ